MNNYNNNYQKRNNFNNIEKEIKTTSKNDNNENNCSCVSCSLYCKCRCHEQKINSMLLKKLKIEENNLEKEIKKANNNMKYDNYINYSSTKKKNISKSTSNIFNEKKTNIFKTNFNKKKKKNSSSNSKTKSNLSKHKNNNLKLNLNINENNSFFYKPENNFQNYYNNYYNNKNIKNYFDFEKKLIHNNSMVFPLNKKKKDLKYLDNLSYLNSTNNLYYNYNNYNAKNNKFISINCDYNNINKNYVEKRKKFLKGNLRTNYIFTELDKFNNKKINIYDTKENIHIKDDNKKNVDENNKNLSLNKKSNNNNKNVINKNLNNNNNNLTKTNNKSNNYNYEKLNNEFTLKNLDNKNIFSNSEKNNYKNNLTKNRYDNYIKTDSINYSNKFYTDRISQKTHQLLYNNCETEIQNNEEKTIEKFSFNEENLNQFSIHNTETFENKKNEKLQLSNNSIKNDFIKNIDLNKNNDEKKEEKNNLNNINKENKINLNIENDFMKSIDKKLGFSYKKKIFLNNDENIKNTTFSFQIINNFNYDIKSKENLIKELENTILLLKKQISNFNNFQITKNINFEILSDYKNIINLNEANKIIQNQQNKIEQLNSKLKKLNENIKYLNEKLNYYQKEEEINTTFSKSKFFDDNFFQLNSDKNSFSLINKIYTKRITFPKKLNMSFSQQKFFNKLKIETDLNIFSLKKPKLSNNLIFTLFSKNKILCFDYENKIFEFITFSDYNNFSNNFNSEGNLCINYNNNIFYIITGKNIDQLYQFNYNKKSIEKLSNLKNNHSKGNLIIFKENNENNNNDNIICISGLFNKKVEIYNIQKKQWDELPELNIERSESTSVILKKQYLFVIFGYNFPRKEYINNIEYLNLKNENKNNNNWNILNLLNENDLNLNMKNLNCINFNDKKIILFGGYNGCINKGIQNFIQIIFDDDFNLDKCFIECVDRKLKDIKKYNCYLFNNSVYEFYDKNNNINNICFDINNRIHLFYINSILTHDVYIYEPFN